jgi:hypothetical protein
MVYPQNAGRDVALGEPSSVASHFTLPLNSAPALAPDSNRPIMMFVLRGEGSGWLAKKKSGGN